MYFRVINVVSSLLRNMKKKTHTQNQIELTCYEKENRKINSGFEMLTFYSPGQRQIRY